MLVAEIFTEKIAKEAIKSLARVFLNLGWEKIIDSKTQQISFDEEQISDASQKYIKNYTIRQGYLKVLGMREPVALLHIIIIFVALLMSRWQSLTILKLSSLFIIGFNQKPISK